MEMMVMMEAELWLNDSDDGGEMMKCK